MMMYGGRCLTFGLPELTFTTFPSESLSYSVASGPVSSSSSSSSNCYYYSSASSFSPQFSAVAKCLKSLLDTPGTNKLHKFNVKFDPGIIEIKPDPNCLWFSSKERNACDSTRSCNSKSFARKASLSTRLHSSPVRASFLFFSKFQ